MSCISYTTATSLSLGIHVIVHYAIAVGVVKVAVGLAEDVQAPRTLSFVVVDHTMMPFRLVLGTGSSG